MRILYVVLGRDMAGGEVVCLQQMRAARTRGYEVCLLVPAPGTTMNSAYDEGFEVKVFPLERTFQLKRALAFAGLLKRWQADLVHTHTGLPGMVLARIGAAIASVPIICHLHLDHSYNANPFIRWLQRLADNITARLSLNIAVSEDTRRRFVEVGNPSSQLIVIPNGVSTVSARTEPVSDLRLSLNVDPACRLIGCVARLDPIKGQRNLLLVLPQIIAEIPKTCLVLVGADIAADGSYDAELRSLANSIGVNENVRFTGYRSDVAALMPEFDIYALPSYREAMPMSILEAMVASKPVVASHVNGIPEVVRHGVTGLLVPPGNLEALADAILMILRDQEMARQMGSAGRTRVEEGFDIDRLNDRLFQLYHQLVDGRRG